LLYCPGFGQDKVNFHRTPGRGTAGTAWTPGRGKAGTAGGWGLTPPGQTEPGIPYHVPSRWVPVGGGQRGGDGLAARECAALVLSEREGLLCESVSYFLLICIVVVTVPSVCCSVKLPLSLPASFCLFLSILLPTAAGGGAAVWRFCCRRQPKPKHLSIPVDVLFISLLLAEGMSPKNPLESCSVMAACSIPCVCQKIGVPHKLIPSAHSIYKNF